jgi:general secretion pathway protein J
MKKSHSGFTLVEILVALAVFAILATLTSSSMYYAFNTRSRITLQADRMVDLQLAITLIQRDTEQAINRAVRGNEMRIFPGFVGQPNYMELTRSGLSNPNAEEKRSTLKRIAILCENNQLIRRSWASVDSVDRNQYEDKVILRDVKQCEFAYLNKNLQVLTEWHSDVVDLGLKQASDSLPKAVRMTLTLSDWGEFSQFFLLPKALYTYENS